MSFSSIKTFCVLLALIPALLFGQVDNPMEFAIIGDYGSHNQGEAKVASLIHQYSPSFIVTLGDNNYKKGCWSTIDDNIGQYYASFIGNYQGSYGPGADENHFFPALGNHDWNALHSCLHHGNLPYLDYFTLPGNGRYYDFVKGPIHFFILDSDSHEPDGTSIKSTQHQWFVDKVKSSTSSFKIVVFHHASYSSGSHGSDKRMQWAFKELGIDLVLSGHDHHYERIEKNDLTYIVNGIGGPSHLSGKGKQISGSKIFYNEKYGFLLGSASNNTIEFKLINEDNKVIDSFSLELASSNSTSNKSGGGKVNDLVG